MLMHIHKETRVSKGLTNQNARLWYHPRDDRIDLDTVIETDVAEPKDVVPLCLESCPSLLAF